MNLFELVSLLIALAAVFSYLNVRFIRLPTTIGVMLVSLAASLLLVILSRFGWGVGDNVARVVASIDFDRVLLHGMLAFLLFAGALLFNDGIGVVIFIVVLEIATGHGEDRRRRPRPG